MATIIPIADLRKIARPNANGEMLDALLDPAASDAVSRTGVLTDSLGRPLRDLRISVTDRCNFRCVYCMPKEVFGREYEFLPRSELLTFEEIERVARVAAGLGVEKVRITGGEPLARRDLERLVAMLAPLPVDL